MEATTIQKYIHTSPRKLRLVVDMVRKLNPNKALEVLALTNKDAAKDLIKSITVTLANAKQMGIDTQKAIFKKIEINQGPKLKRHRASTRGRVRPFARKMSHIRIVISDEKEKK